MIRNVVVSIFRRSVRTMRVDYHLINGDHGVEIPRFLGLFNALKNTRVQVRLPFTVILRMAPTLIRTLQVKVSFTSVFRLHP